MADFVVLSTETIPVYCRILHFSPQCFVTLEVLKLGAYSKYMYILGKYGPTYSMLYFLHSGYIQCVWFTHRYILEKWQTLWGEPERVRGLRSLLV